jgi:fibronectin-binding autotransporter adhesin
LNLGRPGADRNRGVFMRCKISAGNRQTGRLVVGLVAGIVAASLSARAIAASGSWNVDESGDWTNTANWLGGVEARGNTFTGTFANDITADRTVTLDSNVALGALVFGDADPSTAASWDIAGSSTLSINNGTGNTGLITVNALGAGATATISVPVGANVVNTPTIVKDGVGTLVLANTASAFTAALSITAGTLQVSADRNLGGIGSFGTDRITISNGATLRTTAGFTMNANRGITIGSGGGVLDLNGGNLLYAAPVTSSGETLTVTGASSLSLSNTTGTATSVNWDFSGNSGVRTFFAGSDALGTGSVQVGSGIRLVSQNVALTGGQVGNAVTLADGGGLAARNSAGAVEYTNVTFPSSGTVVLNRDDQLTAALTISSGRALTGDLTVDTSQQAANAVGDVTLSGVFSGTGGLIKAGDGASGTLILGGANTYAGDTTINTGTLALAAAGSVANSGGIVVASGATFDVSAVSGGFSLGAGQTLSGSGSVVGGVAADGSLSPGLGGGAGTLSFSSNLALGSGAALDFQLNGTDTTVGGGVNDLIDLAGDLTLDGTLSVAESVPNSFLSANQGDTWRLATYSGSLSGGGLTLGTMPALSSGLSFGIDTGSAGQVNLVVTAVPEPVTILGAGIGLSMLGLAARRKLTGRWS